KDGVPIPNFGEDKKEKRHTINIVFSYHASENKLKEAVYKTIKDKFPDNFFVITFHGDTDNPHCHVCIKVAKSDGKRINIKKQDLSNLRVDFAKNLNNLGIEATAKVKNYEPSFDKILENFDKSLKQKQTKIDNKMHYYQLVDFGKAKYKFDEKNKNSFYVQYRTKKGITTIWSADLKRVVEENNLQKGEMVKFKIIGKQEHNINRKAKIDGKFETIQETLVKPIWSCDVLGRERNIEQIQILPKDIALRLKRMPKLKKYKILKNKIKFREVIDNEKTNREQYRQRIIQERITKAFRGGFIASARNNMRILSKESMVRQREHIRM
ncbi:MobP1 family relaxase, partial [Campylobacter fetus]